MSNDKGIFICIEGGDGSGKGTQAAKLIERLESAGHTVRTFDFPQYERESSYFVRQYLNGAYGNANDTGPYTASLFYALDRYEAADEIRAALDAGEIVVSNRFTGSNMAHQGAKFENQEERFGFFTWLDQLEFTMLNIPRPDISVVLRLDASIGQQNVDKKGERNYTDKKRDIHEADLSHLEKATATYSDLVKLFPKSFTGLDCMDHTGKQRSIEAIAEDIWDTVIPHLPAPRKNSDTTNDTQATSVKQEQTMNKATKSSKSSSKPKNPYVVKNPNGSYSITNEGKKLLDGAITDTESDVYVFTDELPGTTAAAAMARLSRRGDDMRVTLLDEFMGKAGKDEGLLKRVITAYGDDSVQQLGGLHFVIENASNILTKKVEWGRLAAYLEQSTRYIYYDQKDANGQFKYYVPAELDDDTASKFKVGMDSIFTLYSEMVHELTEYVRSNSSVPSEERDIAWKGATRAQACDAARAVLPVATKSTVGVFASGQALENMIMGLMSDDLEEMRNTGRELLEQARKVIPVFLERADKPDRGGATIAYKSNTRNAVRELSEELIPQTLSPQTEAVTLSSFYPRNEYDLVPHMLYESSSQSLEAITETVEDMGIVDKERVFSAYMGERLNRRHKPGRAIEFAHYSFDLVCDYGIFRDLQRHRIVDALEWQQLSPRYGFEVPELIEEAGLTEKFERCFEISLDIYSMLQSSGYELPAQYATLLGHKMRWKITYNAREAFHLHELRTAPQGHPGYRKLVKEMHDKVAEVHPRLADAMRFVNQDEDPELTRLAAERYTQYKLDKLDADGNA